MTVNLKDSEFKADVKCYSYDDISVCFTYPEQLNGFTVHAANGAYELDANGVKDTLAPTLLADNAFIKLLIESIKISVFTNHGSFNKLTDNNGYGAELNVNGTDITLCFDEQGYITALKSSSGVFSAVFTNITDTAVTAPEDINK